MRLQPDADALAFAATVRDLLDRAADSAALRAAWDSADGRVPGLDKRLAEVGVTGLTVPGRHGGSGVDATAALPVLVETGRVPVPEPVVDALVGATALAGAGGAAAAEWLPRIADGSAAVAVGLGPGEVVAAAGWADVLVLRHGREVHVLPADQVRLRPVTSVDKGVRPARVEWRPTPATRLAGVDPDGMLDLAFVAVAAQLVGLAEAMLEMSVRYAGVREQFGRPIGSFQAVKHQLADVYVDVAFARPVAHRAAWSVTQGLPSRARDASHAMHAAALAAGRAARTALQVHGGIGYTFEHDLHMWLKRTWTLSSLWGTPAWHRGRVAADVLADAPPPRVP